ncbi:hypothetical protein B0H19DRAFT_1253832 [Mycena capillaripes]|nr:hypothetical protein B0H19DRAFT_1253832 [Mycena capillaripes]
MSFPATSPSFLPEEPLILAHGCFGWPPVQGRIGHETPATTPARAHPSRASLRLRLPATAPPPRRHDAHPGTHHQWDAASRLDCGTHDLQAPVLPGIPHEFAPGSPPSAYTTSRPQPRMCSERHFSASTPPPSSDSSSGHGHAAELTLAHTPSWLGITSEGRWRRGSPISWGAPLIRRSPRAQLCWLRRPPLPSLHPRLQTPIPRIVTVSGPRRKSR